MNDYGELIQKLSAYCETDKGERLCMQAYAALSELIANCAEKDKEIVWLTQQRDALKQSNDGLCYSHQTLADRTSALQAALEALTAENAELRERLDNACDSCACEIANERDKLREAAAGIVWEWDNNHIEPYSPSAKEYIERLRKLPGPPQKGSTL